MTATQPAVSVPRTYYAATVLFLLLDCGLDINVRFAFLNASPGWRATWYAACAGCFVVTLWRPAWSLPVMTAESLVTLAALIVWMGSRVITAPDPLYAGDRVTLAEIGNFMIAGFAAWYSWQSGSAVLSRRRHRLDRQI